MVVVGDDWGGGDGEGAWRDGDGEGATGKGERGRNGRLAHIMSIILSGCQLYILTQYMKLTF